MSFAAGCDLLSRPAARTGKPRARVVTNVGDRVGQRRPRSQTGSQTGQASHAGLRVRTRGTGQASHAGLRVRTRGTGQASHAGLRVRTRDTRQASHANPQEVIATASCARARPSETKPAQPDTATRHRNPTPQPDIATTDAGTRRTSRNVRLDLKQQRGRRQVVSGLTTEHVRRQVQTGLHGSVSRIPDGRSPSHASESRPNRARAEIQSRLRQSAESHHRLIDDAALPQRPTRRAPRESRPQSRSSAIFPAEPSQVGA
jgi:hypothetical protein